MIAYKCSCCGTTHVLPELVWEAGDDAYIKQLECLQCGEVTKVGPTKKEERAS